MTTPSGYSALSRRAVSIPSISGIRTSKRMSCGLSVDRQCQCLGARGCFSHRHEPGGRADHLERNASEVRLIVDDQDADPHRFLKRH